MTSRCLVELSVCLTLEVVNFLLLALVFSLEKILISFTVKKENKGKITKINIEVRTHKSLQ